MPDFELKHDKGKTRFELLPMDSVEAIAEVLTFGAEKYAANSWQNVEPDRYVGALLRHFAAWRMGEIRDPDSDLLHVAHMATNALFLLHFEIEKLKGDKTK